MEAPGMSGKTSKGWSQKKFEGEWAKTLQKFLEKQQDEVPKGWIRAEEALRRMGFSGNSCGQRNKILNAMTRDGVLLKKEFRVFDGSGRRISAIVHYKIA
jgi:hypothetical protein